MIKKGIYRPLSDFNFEYLTKVTANKACSTGYMIKVTPENIQRTNEHTSSEDELEDEVSSRSVTSLIVISLKHMEVLILYILARDKNINKQLVTMCVYYNAKQNTLSVKKCKANQKQHCKQTRCNQNL